MHGEEVRAPRFGLFGQLRVLEEAEVGVRPELDGAGDGDGGQEEGYVRFKPVKCGSVTERNAR